MAPSPGRADKHVDYSLMQFLSSFDATRNIHKHECLRFRCLQLNVQLCVFDMCRPAVHTLCAQRNGRLITTAPLASQRRSLRPPWWQSGGCLCLGLPGTCAPASALTTSVAPCLCLGLPDTRAPALALTTSVALPRGLCRPWAGLGCPTCHMCLRLSWRAAASLGPSQASCASYVLHTFSVLCFTGSSEPNLF